MLLAPYLMELLAERFTTGAVPERLAMFDPDRFAPDDTGARDEGDYYARYAGRGASDSRRHGLNETANGGPPRSIPLTRLIPRGIASKQSGPTRVTCPVGAWLVPVN
jgi:hypothetical protein